jgi:hypothetical protein
MAKKKSSKKTVKQSGDYYAEGVNFSDDPADSFYATGEGVKKRKRSTTSFNKELIWGFQLWELAVLFIEAVLLVYAILVLLGVLPLF